MPEIVLVLTIVSGAATVAALGIAGWHHLRLEWLRFHSDVPPDRPN